jgi:hypothetical protein
MMPTDGDYGIWPDSGEIDLLEVRNHHRDDDLRSRRAAS